MEASRHVKFAVGACDEVHSKLSSDDELGLLIIIDSCFGGHYLRCTTP